MASSNPNMIGRSRQHSSSAPARLSRVEMRKFNKRANGPDYYSETERYRTKGLPHKAPVPGYTGYVQGMNMDFGVSKAFGLPIELMEIPKTPDAFREEF
eukprot:gene9844-15547_t